MKAILPSIQGVVYELLTFTPVSFQEASPDLYQADFPNVAHFFQVIPIKHHLKPLSNFWNICLCNQDTSSQSKEKDIFSTY